MNKLAFLILILTYVHILGTGCARNLQLSEEPKGLTDSRSIYYINNDKNSYESITIYALSSKRDSMHSGLKDEAKPAYKGIDGLTTGGTLEPIVTLSDSESNKLMLEKSGLKIKRLSRCFIKSDSANPPSYHTVSIPSQLFTKSQLEISQAEWDNLNLFNKVKTDSKNPSNGYCDNSDTHYTIANEGSVLIAQKIISPYFTIPLYLYAENTNLKSYILVKETENELSDSFKSRYTQIKDSLTGNPLIVGYGNSITGTKINSVTIRPKSEGLSVNLIADNSDFKIAASEGVFTAAPTIGFANSLGLNSKTTAQYKYSGNLVFTSPKSILTIHGMDEIRVRLKIVKNPVYFTIRFNGNSKTEVQYYLPASTPLNMWFTYYYVIPKTERSFYGDSISVLDFIHEEPGEIILDDLSFVQTDGGSLSTSGVPSQLAGRPQVPPNSIFRTDISSLPVLSSSSEAWLTNLSGFIHPDFGAAVDSAGNLMYGIPLNIASTTSTKRIPFTLHYDESDFIPEGYPYQANFKIEYGVNPSSDRHLLVADPNNGDLFEQWQSFPTEVPAGYIPDGMNSTPKAPFAVDGTYWNLNSNACRKPGWTSADAAGLPIYPLILTYEDIAQGDLQHMLRFTKDSVRGVIWPASHKTDSTMRSLNGYHSDAFDKNSMPFGTILRLKANFDIRNFSLTNQRILRGLKKYGMILADNGGQAFVSGAPDSRWNDGDLDKLKSISIRNNFEVVDVSSKMVRPTSYESN